MRIRRIRLTNVGPHELTDWRLEPGVIGILGPNGCGKSTSVNAAYAALTNDYSRFEGGKQGAIRQQADEKAKASILVDVEHEGHTYEIERSLRPDKHSFRFVGSTQAPLTKAGEIAVAVEETLGITRSLLDNYVFVAQWDMFAFIGLTETERAKHFAKLCGTVGAELRWNLLGKQLELDRGLAAEVVDSRDTLKQELAESQRRKDELAAKLVAAEDRRLDKEELERTQGIGPKRQRYIRAKRDLVQVQQEEEEQLESAKKATATVKKAEEDLKKAQTALRRAQDAVDDQGTELVELQGKLRRAEQRAGWEAELKQLQEAAQEAPEWPEELEDMDAAAIREAAQEAEEAFTAAQELIGNCGGTEQVECPTCKTPTTAGSLHDRLVEAEENLPTLEQEHQVAAAMLTLLEGYEQDLRDHKVWLAGFDAEVKQLKSNIKKCPDVDEEQVRERITELDGVVDTRNRCRNDVAACEKALPRLRKKKTDAIAEHRESKQRRVQLEETIETEKVSRKAAERAEVRLEKHNKAVEEAAGFRAQIKEIQNNQQSVKNRIKEIKTAIEQSKKGRDWAAFLAQARAVMHRDRLPAEVHKAVLGEMEYGINVSLEDFDAPFIVRANEGLSFTAYFHDGVVMPAPGLSGGQKVTLALPFRLQVNSMFAAQVGMLVLDEPTAGLDADRVEAVVEVFGALRSVAKAQGFQIVVITHEMALERAFDQVFHVGSSLGIPGR